MSAAAAFPACPNVQEALEQAFLANQLVPSQTPFLDFLLSGMNTRNVLQRLQSPGRGKVKQVELTYQQRIAESDVGTTIDFTCTGGDKQPICTETYSIDTTAGVYLKRAIDADDLKDICEDNELYWEKTLANMMDACARKAESRALLGASLLTGKFPTNDTKNVNGARTLKTVDFVDGSGDFTLDAYKEIVFTASQARYMTVPIVFGANDTTKYFTEVNAGCCATDGISVEQFAANNQVVYYDTLGNVETQWGADEFIVTSAGAMQAIWHLQFQGFDPININPNRSNFRGVIVDPRRNMPFDVRISDNCNVLTVEMALAIDIVGLPDDMFPTGDRLDGVTYVNNFKHS